MSIFDKSTFLPLLGYDQCPRITVLQTAYCKIFIYSTFYLYDKTNTNILTT